MGYTERQDMLRAEALRTVPGIMAAKHRNDVAAAARLIDDLHRTATSLGVTDGMTWQILFSATLHWAIELSNVLADDRDISPEQICQGIGMSAASWLSAERGVGGY